MEKMVGCRSPCRYWEGRWRFRIHGGEKRKEARGELCSAALEMSVGWVVLALLWTSLSELVLLSLHSTVIE